MVITKCKPIQVDKKVADVEVLENTIRENEVLRETVQATAPNLRNPRIIAYDILNDVNGTDVVKAACEQANVRADTVSVKFPIHRK